jgi:nucleotide-diphospho-sugar transferase
MDTGVVLVATGAETYIELAARAAASVKRHCPGLAVDLFTDAPRALPGFDRIHLLADPWFRSKIDGLLGSRFERTLYMDADMLALADFRDVFDVLERFDIALAHDWLRNSALHHTFWRKPLPPAFPQFNGGLMAIRRTPATTGFLQDWKAAVQSSDTGRDQISLRELLWDSELRIATLPEEYNLLWLQGVRSWTTDFAAPRIIHSPLFHRDFNRYARARDPAAERMGLVASAKLPTLIAADRGLARLRGEAPSPVPPGDRAWLRRVLAGLPRTLAARLRRRLARLGARRPRADKRPSH